MPVEHQQSPKDETISILYWNVKLTLPKLEKDGTVKNPGNIENIKVAIEGLISNNNIDPDFIFLSDFVDKDENAVTQLLPNGYLSKYRGADFESKKRPIVLFYKSNYEKRMDYAKDIADQNSILKKDNFAVFDLQTPDNKLLARLIPVHFKRISMLPHWNKCSMCVWI